jgi:hypothetical protein
MSYCVKNNCTTTNHNRYAGSGGAMLKKKYANKFNKVSSNKQFSINGKTNHSYIGNPNSIITHDPFSSVSENSSYNARKINVSVKSSKGYLNSICSANNSAACYKRNNSALLDISGSLNKHLRGENRVQSLYIENLKAKCSLLTDYVTEMKNNVANVANVTSNSACINKINRNLSSSSRIERLINCNNTVKNSNFFNGFTPDYSLYYNDSSLYKKIAACNLHNPPDAKVIAC